MNEERLLKIIQDMSESIAQLNKCESIIKHSEEDEKTVFIILGLKQLFVDFFITVEDFTSLMLKELGAFKIGIDMRTALEVLKDRQILKEDSYSFLQKARMLRNRISHRYKEPSKEELLEFVEQHEEDFRNTLEAVKKCLKSA